jgi:hypothetical protein
MNFFAFLAKSNLKYAFVAMVRPSVPSLQHCAINLRSPISTYSPRRIDWPSSRNLLLPNHRPTGSDPPRSRRREMERVLSRPSVANAGVRSSRCVAYSSQNSARCVHGGVGRPRHRGLQVSTMGACGLFERLTNNPPVRLPSLYCLREYTRICLGHRPLKGFIYPPASFGISSPC